MSRKNIEPTYRVVSCPKDPEVKYVSNKITTSLYTWWNFLPKTLYEELLLKLANFFFVVVSALQCIVEISNTGGVPTTLGPLVLVLAINITMKALEDVKRHRADRTTNNSPTLCVVNGAATPIKWVDVRVGDVLLVANREQAPADLLVLAVDEPDPQCIRGGCHVETKSLDGETNLKGKSATSATTSVLGATQAEQLANVAKLRARVECEQPNAATNKFTGMLYVDGGEPTPLSVSNMMMRGSSLRNTEYILGLVINTGVDTKVMQGTRKPPLKMSSIDSLLNPVLLVIITLLVSLCVIGSGGMLAWLGNPSIRNAWYLPRRQENFMINLGIYFLLLSSFVSVTLISSVLVVKNIQSYFMENSLQMYHEETDTPMKVRTFTLNDELGCVDFVFSDKTGTLTQNVMQFRKCSVAGVSYGKGTTEIGLARLRRLGLPLPPASESDGAASSAVVNFDGPELLAALDGAAGATAQAACRDFFLHLALCHTVVTEVIDEKKSLSASSPDEAALVAAAAHFGLDFIDRLPGGTVVLTDKKVDKLINKNIMSELKYEVLDVLEFSSARRRMSVVVRDGDGGKLRLLTKGADSVMLKLLGSGQEKLVAATEQIMEEHSNEGLRCLVIAARDLDAPTYLEWSARYRAALTNLSELEKKSRDEPNAIDALMDEMEKELTLLGSTAIEDKLQDGVPATIRDLSRAGIGTWVLTGDKEETAINIGFACQLLDTATQLLVINKKSHPLAADVQRALADAAKAAAAAPTAARRALVIDGDCLEAVLATNPDTHELVGCQTPFLQFTQHCASVVCCRCAPSQKAQVCSLVRYSVKGATTLAIGDGANDVAMIQAAHIGVGISGQEGMQAANSADYAFAQFRFLRELLLVHGRNNYRNVSTLVYYILYKNVMMYLTQYWYLAFFNFFSGQKFNLEIGSQFFNVVFTGFPIIWICIFDRDVSDEASRRLPQLYALGPRRFYFNARVFARWLVEGFYESLLITILCVYSLQNTAGDTGMGGSVRGEDATLWVIGANTLTIVVFTVNVKLCLWQWQWHRASYALLFISLAFWYIGVVTASSPLSDSVAVFVVGWLGLWWTVHTNATFWLLLLLVPIVVLLPQLLVVVWSRRFYPEFRDLVMEAEYHNLGEEAMAKLEAVQLRPRALPLRPRIAMEARQRSRFSRKQRV